MDFKSSQKKYNQFSRYLKETFAEKVYKVTIDAGFNCPNRDGSKGSNGCIFCDDGGSFSRAQDARLSVKKQLEQGIENLSTRFKARKFISYLQAYSNTYKDVDELKKIYDEAVDHKDVVGLSIGTRPDCVDKEKLDLIQSYTKDKMVWIEYGLQSSNNETLNFINRGHDVEEFVEAVKMTQNRGIKICAHVIIGLPNDTKEDIIKTAKLLADLNIDGVKLHLLCILKNTKLEKMYNDGLINIMEQEEYVESICDFLELLPAHTTIHRLAGNGLKEIRVAPKWLGRKFEILNMIDAELEKRGSYQGSKF